MAAAFWASGHCTIAQGAFPGSGSKADWLKANGFFAEGNQLREQKKYAEAVAKYNEAIAIYGADGHYYYNLGIAERSLGDANAAAAAFHKAVEINARDWRAEKALGNCYYRLGRYAEAREAFQQAAAGGAPARELAELRKGINACRSRMAKP